MSVSSPAECSGYASWGVYRTPCAEHQSRLSCVCVLVMYTPGSRAWGGRYLPEWMVSASLSGISMLNSYNHQTGQCSGLSMTNPLHSKKNPSTTEVLSSPLNARWGIDTYLLNGHHNLDGVQAVQAKVVGKVRGGLDLIDPRCHVSVDPRSPAGHVPKWQWVRTLPASLTCCYEVVSTTSQPAFIHDTRDQRAQIRPVPSDASSAPETRPTAALSSFPVCPSPPPIPSKSLVSETPPHHIPRP